MKCLLVVIAYCLILTAPVKAQELAGKMEQRVQVGALNGSEMMGGGQAKLGHHKETSAGQQRIAYIKNKYEERKVTLQNSIQKGEVMVIKAKDRIALAKDYLAKDKQEHRVSEEVYAARKERLEMIEQKARDLERKLLKNKHII